MTTPNTAVDTTVADAIENSTMSSLKPTSARMKRASIVAPSIGHFIAPYGTCIASTTKTIQATKHPAIGVGGGTDRMGKPWRTRARSHQWLGRDQGPRNNRRLCRLDRDDRERRFALCVLVAARNLCPP